MSWRFRAGAVWMASCVHAIPTSINWFGVLFSTPIPFPSSISSGSWRGFDSFEPAELDLLRFSYFPHPSLFSLRRMVFMQFGFYVVVVSHIVSAFVLLYSTFYFHLVELIMSMLFLCRLRPLLGSL
jgi:hypothetical protein